MSFRKLKAQIYWPTTDQKVRGSNPCGRTIRSAIMHLRSFSYTVLNVAGLSPVQPVELNLVADTLFMESWGVACYLQEIGLYSMYEKKNNH